MQQPPLFPPENPYAAPAQYGAQAPREGPGMPATFWTRAFARIVDTIFLSIGSRAIQTILREVDLFHSQHARGREAVLARAFFVSLVAPIVYSTFAEAISGAGLGKLVFRLRARNENGGPITFVGALLRNFLYLADVVLFGLVAYLFMKDSPRQQRLGDRVGHTMVITSLEHDPIRNLLGVGVGVVGFAVVVVGSALLL